jgi:hypothetical protein
MGSAVLGKILSGCGCSFLGSFAAWKTGNKSREFIGQPECCALRGCTSKTS